MDKLFLQLTNQVEAGYHNERLSLENACYKIARAEEEIKSLELKITNIDTEMPNIIKEFTNSIWASVFSKGALYFLTFLIQFVIFKAMAVSSNGLEIISPVILLIIGNLLGILFIAEMCVAWERNRSLMKMDKPERITYLTSRINLDIGKQKEIIEENTIKAKQHASNMKELERLHNSK
ncbi:TPA: hypothetical protein NIE69_002124 [Pseudomonas aeruginosa]|nr:hypothetical protein [Pseudomonas aeruginosa]